MACIRVGVGSEFCDGDYSGFCSREKRLRHFAGTVSLTQSGRVLVTGPCETCTGLITNVLYTP